MEDKEKKQEKQEQAGTKETKPVQTELEKTKAERDEYLAGWQRAKADFINHKKQSEAMMKEFRVMANEGLIEELLPVLQSFEMAFANKETWERADKNWRMGVEHIYNQLKGVLEQNGLREINPLGQKFDHTMHEAVQYEPATESAEEGSIIKVIEKGYSLGSKPIRPAKVVVAGE